MPHSSSINSYHFGNFLAVISDSPQALGRLQHLAAFLPHSVSNAYALTLHGFRMVRFPPDRSPLFHDFVVIRQDEVVYVCGDFYNAHAFFALRSALIADTRADVSTLSIVRTHIPDLNGPWCALIASPKTRSCRLFMNPIGFHFLYYGRSGSDIWISSSLWPLLRHDAFHKPDADAILDTLLLGYPCGNATLARDVRIVLPGTEVLITSDAIVENHWWTPPERTITSLSTAMQAFDETAASHFADVQGRLPVEAGFANSLTAGWDTRVILNAMSAHGIVPHCFSGRPGENSSWDTQGAQRVALLARCPYTEIDYNDADPTMRADSTVAADGARTGLWMAHVARASSQASHAAYFGFTGGLIAATTRMPAAQSDVRFSALSRFAFESYYEYASPLPAFLHNLSPSYTKRFKERFDHTFEPFLQYDQRNAYLLQRLASRSFRRIGSFAYGSRIGNPSFCLFHDLRVFNLYLSTSWTILIDRGLHRQLASYAIPELAGLGGSQHPYPDGLKRLLKHCRHLYRLGHYALVASRKPSPQRVLNYTVNPPAPDLIRALAMLYDHTGIKPEDFNHALSKEHALGGRPTLLLHRLSAVYDQLQMMFEGHAESLKRSSLQSDRFSLHTIDCGTSNTPEEDARHEVHWGPQPT